MSGVLLLALVAGVAAYARLSAGPVDLNDYLGDISARISERLPGARLDIAGAAIALDDNGVANLVVTDATLIDDETGPFAHVPEAKAAFRLSDLAQGVIDPSNVILSGVEAKLVRTADGAFQFGFAGPKEDGEAEGVAAFGRLLAAVATEEGEAVEPSAIPEARGQILQLADAEVIYEDRLSGRTYASSDAAIFIWRGVDGVYSNAALTYDDGFEEPTRATFSGKRFEDGRIQVAASLANASPRDVADQISALDWLEAFDAQVDAELNIEFTEAGELLALDGSLRGGEGFLRLGPDASEPVTSTELTYAFEPENERFLVERVAIRSDRLSIDGVGFVEVNRDEAGEVSDIVAQLEFADVDVSAPEFLDAPLAYEEAKFTGRLTLEPLTLEIGEVRVVQGAMRLNAAGRLWREGEDWRADVTAGGTDFTLKEMLDHWPRQAAPGALLWMRENMSGARILEADAFARLGGDDEDVKIDFTFEGAAGTYLAPMPPIRDAVGAGQVDLQKFTLSLDQGFVTVGEAGVISLAGSKFVVTDLDHPANPAEVLILAEGPTAAALALIDEEPLALTRQLGVPLGEVGGTAQVRAEGGFPLLKDLLLEDVKITASAVLTDVALEAPGLGVPVSSRELALEADTEGFALSGDAVVDGIAANIEWKEQFSPAARTIDVAATATPKTLARLGLEGPWFPEGAARVRARLAPTGDDLAFDARIDLSKTRLVVEEIAWDKPMDAPSEARAQGVVANGSIRLDALSLETPDLSFDGSARLTEEGDLMRLEAREAKYAGVMDLRATAMREGEGWRVSVAGPMLNLSKFDLLGDEDLTAAAEDAGGPSTAVRADLDIGEIRLNEERFFRNVKGRVAQSVAGGIDVELDGALGDGGPVEFIFARDPQTGGELTLRTGDAGRFLRDAGVFDDGSGGDLLVEGDIAPGEALKVKGRAVVRDIVIHEDAKVEQMLSGADLAALQETMREEGIVFSSIRAPFELSDGRITLSEAIAKGSAIGVSISGDYGLDSEALDFKGVFTPAYALNSALGNIPVLGAIFTGGDGQGMFAFNFAVRGNAKDPKVSVNPFSILAPGIFRTMLSGSAVDDEVDAAFRADAADNSRR
ncbi:MAG: AsmA-like C-terminal region-containing protein [Pseudomonadota bacterium]